MARPPTPRPSAPCPARRGAGQRPLAALAQPVTTRAWHKPARIPAGRLSAYGLLVSMPILGVWTECTSRPRANAGASFTASSAKASARSTARGRLDLALNTGKRYARMPETQDLPIAPACQDRAEGDRLERSYATAHATCRSLAPVGDGRRERPPGPHPARSTCATIGPAASPPCPPASTTAEAARSSEKPANQLLGSD